MRNNRAEQWHPVVVSFRCVFSYILLLQKMKTVLMLASQAKMANWQLQPKSILQTYFGQPKHTFRENIFQLVANILKWKDSYKYFEGQLW